MKIKFSPIIYLITSLFIVWVAACEKQSDEPGQQDPPEELSVPEKVEQEILDILSKDWKQLADTLHYFDSTMLKQGVSSGKGPDGVYYELDVNIVRIKNFQARFIVADSVWLYAEGSVLPLDLSVDACQTLLNVKSAAGDSLSLSANGINVISPSYFILSPSARASLSYCDERVGYLTLDEYEDLDYTTGKHITVHYYNDNRTFSFYENGFLKFVTMLDEVY